MIEKFINISATRSILNFHGNFKAQFDLPVATIITKIYALYTYTALKNILKHEMRDQLCLSQKSFAVNRNYYVPFSM